MAAAAAEFRLGQTVTMAAPLADSAADNPEPGTRHMKHLPAEASAVAGLSFAEDQLTINALGLYLLDYLQFEDLRAACEAAARWSFLAAIAPLRLPRATGSPVNPIAML